MTDSTARAAATAQPDAPLHWADPARQAAFEFWLQQVTPRQALVPGSVRLASADASFRRYLRLDCRDGAGTRLNLLSEAGATVSNVKRFSGPKGYCL